ncbi:Zn-dependent exopeptidase [Wilcoxina mikolae CBS 423.85]|nr:Zn-dependent exopeptidase [Wilcoxina mikolae CBS 423.85]
MLGKHIIPTLFVLYSITIACSSAPHPVNARKELRLVKTSEDAPAVWVTEGEKFTKFISKGLRFIDITESRDLEVLAVSKKHYTFPSKPSHQKEAQPLISKLQQMNLERWVTALAWFYNRYYKSAYGTEAAEWLYKKTVEVASKNPLITVSRFNHSCYNQPSVIAKIPAVGTSSSVVIVSAHFDSINRYNTSGRVPGAEDNTSGVVTILEALRVLAEAKFKPSSSSLEFHFYSGEEGGLLGSLDVMNDYSHKNVNVSAMMNQDMTGYAPNNAIAIFTDFVHPSLTNFLATLVPVYTQLGILFDECGYGCSDHASAYLSGYPAAYVADEIIVDSSPYIHSANDTVDKLDFSHILEHSKLTVGFCVEASYF